ncbi:MAG TPA: hypothetical protein VGC42_16865 [Kofleriaceae bacterium]
MSHDRGHRGHKDLQVCRQVFDALSLAMGELDDPLIVELVLESVTPAPNASRVQINLMPARAGIDREAALAALAKVTPELRAQVAAELTRKRVPELVFQLGYPTLI